MANYNIRHCYSLRHVTPGVSLFFIIWRAFLRLLYSHDSPPFFYTARQTLPLGIAGALTTEAYFITG
jgi:hypothetical protein